MELRICDTADATAAAAAQWLSNHLWSIADAKGEASLALSGGRTPWRMLEALGVPDLPWQQLRVFQVDERAVAFDDERRNGRLIANLLLQAGKLSAEHFYGMPAENPSLDAAADGYAATLAAQLGDPPILDVVQLGLGADAHTASLIPGDPLLDVVNQTVGVCGVYQGTRRLSLTFPVLNAARTRLWLVTGADKVDALAALIAGDPSLPCGRVSRENALIFADKAAASRVPDSALLS